VALKINLHPSPAPNNEYLLCLATNDLDQISDRHAAPPLPTAVIRRGDRAPCFIVRDANKQALAFIYCARMSPVAARRQNLLTRDEARRCLAEALRRRILIESRRHAASHREAREMGLLASSTHAFRSYDSKALSASAGNFLYCTSASAHFHR
jgi:hypothetical protein